MRIKTDFVTNSSSTAYVFYIPQDLEITIEDLKATSNYEDFDDEDEYTDDDLLEAVHEHLEIIKKGGQTNEYTNDFYESYSIIEEILHNKAHLITSIDLGSDSGCIIGVTAKTIQKIEDKIHGTAREIQHAEIMFDPNSIEK